MTLIEVLVVVAIIGILSNLIVPGLMMQIRKARATHIVSEYKLIQNAVHSHYVDEGEAPATWFSMREHPDLARYMTTPIQYQADGMYKFFIQYPTAWSGSLPFESAYLLYDPSGGPLLDAVLQVYDGATYEFVPGRIVALIIN